MSPLSGQLQYNQMDPDTQIEYIEALRIKQQQGTLSLIEQDALVSYLWRQRLIEPIESMEYIFGVGLISLVYREDYLIDQVLQYLYAIGTQNTKQQEDRIAVQSAYARLKNACVQSETVLDADATPVVTQKSLITDYIRIRQKSQDSLAYVQWMTRVQKILQTYATNVGDTDIDSINYYEKTMFLRDICDFFLEVADDKIFPLVLQYRFPDLFEPAASTESSQTEPPQSTPRDAVNAAFTNIQNHITTTYGDITTMSPADITPVLTYLSEQAEAANDPKINELIYFDTTTETFQWNDALLSSPA